LHFLNSLPESVTGALLSCLHYSMDHFEGAGWVGQR
jgi:hypothetical protein